MQAIKLIKSKTVVLVNSDIDTDQIIPARFLTTTERDGLGKHLFSEWRFDDQGNLRDDFVLNTQAAENCSVLVAGDNFGCGSSREHAPWALIDYGFEVVLSTSMADIFRSNALKNGLLAIVIEPELHQYLLAQPGLEITVDLEQQTIVLHDGTTHKFELDRFARYCMLNGVDELGFLLNHNNDIDTFEKARA